MRKVFRQTFVEPEVTRHVGRSEVERLDLLAVQVQRHQNVEELVSGNVFNVPHHSGMHEVERTVGMLKCTESTLSYGC